MGNMFQRAMLTKQKWKTCALWAFSQFYDVDNPYVEIHSVGFIYLKKYLILDSVTFDISI